MEVVSTGRIRRVWMGRMGWQRHRKARSGLGGGMYELQRTTVCFRDAACHGKAHAKCPVLRAEERFEEAVGPVFVGNHACVPYLEPGRFGRGAGSKRQVNGLARRGVQGVL
jgi:hypothetical protein